MTHKVQRAAVAKIFREHKVALRKGHWRYQGEEVTWWIDLRAASPSPTSPLAFEVGAWVKGAGPEPEGGAIDCPLLVDVPAGNDAAVVARQIISVITAHGQLADLNKIPWPGAHLDASLRQLLGR